MSPSIETDKLGLRYGKQTALNELSISLEGGKIYGLLGRNGSGKSSLLSVIAGFRKASEGSVLVDGEAVFENRRVTRQICLIREGGDVDGPTATDEKVSSALEFAASMRPNWDDGYARSLLDHFGIPVKKKLSELSRGQRSAVGVTLGLASRAPLTMFDESYLGLDAPSRYFFYDEVLREYMEHPRTMVISTHLIEEVSRLFEEVVIIDRGRLLIQDSAERMQTRGATVTGSADAVDRFVRGLRVLHEKQLGRTKSAVIYGNLDVQQRQEAEAGELDLGPLPLQDVFVHMTAEKEEVRV